MPTPDELVESLARDLFDPVLHGLPWSKLPTDAADVYRALARRHLQAAAAFIADQIDDRAIAIPETHYAMGMNEALSRDEVTPDPLVEALARDLAEYCDINTWSFLSPEQIGTVTLRAEAHVAAVRAQAQQELAAAIEAKYDGARGHREPDLWLRGFQYAADVVRNFQWGDRSTS